MINTYYIYTAAQKQSFDTMPIALYGYQSLFANKDYPVIWRWVLLINM